MRRLLACCLALLLLLPAGCSKEPSQKNDLLPEEQKLVGEWRMVEMIDLTENEVTDVSAYGFKLSLRDDRTGTLQVADNAFSLTWAYDKTDDGGNERYRTDLDGAAVYLFYMHAYDQLWLQNGSITYLFEK